MDKNFLKQSIQMNRMRRLSNSEKPQFPSIKEMANNLKNDIKENVKSVMAGNPLQVESSEAQRRKGICESCPFYAKSQDRCTKCGCNMGIKTYLKSSKCPVGKW
jgi:hypothetical protein